VVDHQSVVIEFEDGATATLNMIGGLLQARAVSSSDWNDRGDPGVSGGFPFRYPAY